MKFQFNINLSDQDYLDYNMFWMMKSPYGKKQITTLRTTISIFILFLIALFIFSRAFSAYAIIGVITMIIVLILVQLFFPRFLAWSIKEQIESLKENGKMGYSPSSVMEFYEDCFVETTSDNKMEQKYSVIERISIVDNKKIYIHVNNVMAFILPLSCFESKEQYDNFLEFIKTKCTNIDTY